MRARRSLMQYNLLLVRTISWQKLKIMDSPVDIHLRMDNGHVLRILSRMFSRWSPFPCCLAPQAIATTRRSNEVAGGAVCHQQERSNRPSKSCVFFPVFFPAPGKRPCMLQRLWYQMRHWRPNEQKLLPLTSQSNPWDDCSNREKGYPKKTRDHCSNSSQHYSSQTILVYTL